MPKRRTTADRQDKLIAAAIKVMERRLSYGKDQPLFENPNSAIQFIRLKLSECEREVFSAMFLNTRHRLIAYEELFKGSIDSATVHPREVVRRAMFHNAAAVILAHNHPSGVAEPSAADAAITRRLVDALALVDVRVLDHMVVGSHSASSMAALGLM